MSGKRGNGEGSIYQRKDGRWVGQYLIHTSGGPKYRYLYGKERKDVAKRLTKAMADRDGGLIFDAGAMTVSEYLDTWMKSSVKGSVRVSTYERQESIVRLHIVPLVGKLKLKTLTPAHVQGLYQDRLEAGLSPASVHKIHVVLHKALKQAVRWSLIPRNVTEAVTAPRPIPHEVRPLSREQVRELFRAVQGNRLEALYVLAVTTGLRQGELLALKWEDVNLEGGALHVRRTVTRERGRISLGEPKTKKSRRTVKLASQAVQALRDHLRRQLEEIEYFGDSYRDEGLIFTSEAGTLINASNLRKRSFEPLLVKARLPKIRSHDPRHTCATLLLLKNTHPKIVQEMLGHATIAITLDAYSHVLPGMGDTAARTMEELLF